jgi:hypothetical protein
MVLLRPAVSVGADTFGDIQQSGPVDIRADKAKRQSKMVQISSNS